MQRDLFEGTDDGLLKLKDGAYLLKTFALSSEQELIKAIQSVSSEAPFRHLMTPGGRKMSVAMTNCGLAGWVSDKRGYRYDHLDPLSNKPWPAMPSVFLSLAQLAAKNSGFSNFLPNSCLINRYETGARLALHQDKDEGDFSQPIVSVSLGLPAKFLFGGLKRSDKPVRTQLAHGDVVVWGNASRLAYHGIDKLKEGHHELTGAYRYNLTFRSTKIIENLE